MPATGATPAHATEDEVLLEFSSFVARYMIQIEARNICSPKTVVNTPSITADIQNDVFYPMLPIHIRFLARYQIKSRYRSSNYV